MSVINDKGTIELIELVLRPSAVYLWLCRDGDKRTNVVMSHYIDTDFFRVYLLVLQIICLRRNRYHVDVET